MDDFTQPMGKGRVDLQTSILYWREVFVNVKLSQALIIVMCELELEVPP